MNKLEQLLTMIAPALRDKAVILIDDIISNPSAAHVDINTRIGQNEIAILGDILDAVHECTGIHVTQMQMKSRLRDIVEARQIYCFISRVETGLSLAVIGKVINRDHATVLHSMRSILGLIAFNQHNRHQLDCVLRVLEEKGYNRARRYYNEAVGQAVREKFDV